MSDVQVKSKTRVADHGEVFTAQREVNAMLDLVKQETERIDSRFLEPACGDGNFLAEILRRKLAAVKTRYKKSPADFEKYAVVAATSIYGVDILQDNVQACRARLFYIWDGEYSENCKGECREDCRDAVRYILSRNILCGNALGIFSSTKREQKLSDLGDTLEQLNQIVDWEMFRATLEDAVRKEAKGPGGRPRYEVVMMFKVLVLARLFNLSDDQAEYQINDRISFMRFLDLGLNSMVTCLSTKL